MFHFDMDSQYRQDGWREVLGKNCKAARRGRVASRTNCKRHDSPRLWTRSCPNHSGVRTCVIFNPTAKGNKARNFRRHLDEFATGCSFKQTMAVGDGRKLATEAVAEGFEITVAAGGDGTLNEVL